MTEKERLLNIGLYIDNEYLDKYIELIESNRTTLREKFKTERHHIIPRMWFNYRKEKVDNSESNIVNLLYKDHILAHYYLYKCTISPISECNLKVFIRMTFYKLKVDEDELEKVYLSISDDIQELYTQYKILNSIQSKGRKSSYETRRKISEANKGKKRSEETRLKMRKPKSKIHIQHMCEAQKKRKRTPEWNQSIKEGKQGVHWYTNGEINVQRRECPDGFYLGRTITISDEQKQKIIEGRKKYGAWNKGLTKEDYPSLARPNNGKYKRKGEN